MSTFTQNWTEDKIRAIIHKLDEKTGLDGASLPISFSSYGWFLGHCRHVEPKSFGFNRKFFNNQHIGHSSRETSHGADWKWACKMVGADPTRCHNQELFSNVEWSVEDALNAYYAKDVVAMNILSYIDKWGRVPLDIEEEIKLSNRIKARNPDAFYEVGDEILHPKRGFGVIEDVIPCDHWTQNVYVAFADHTHGVFNTQELCKIVDGKAVPFSRHRR